jgi:guanylate cyclase, other
VADAGEYFVVGMDIEQYEASNPEKYLKGILHSEQEPWVGQAYRSYLAVLPSSLVGFDDFAKKVKIGREIFFIKLSP